MSDHRLIAGIAALALSAALIAATQTGSPATAALRPVVLTSIHMATPTTGWGLTMRAMVRTTDGGVHWKDVTPPGYPPSLTPRGYVINKAAAFVGADNAWATWWQSGQALAILHTPDGGRTWTSVHPTQV